MCVAPVGRRGEAGREGRRLCVAEEDSPPLVHPYKGRRGKGQPRGKEAGLWMAKIRFSFSCGWSMGCLVSMGEATRPIGVSRCLPALVKWARDISPICTSLPAIPKLCLGAMCRAALHL